MLFNTVSQTVDLGWDFFVPVILFVVLIALAVPVWACCHHHADDVRRPAA